MTPPLVPAEVDLRGMPFMPLDVNRLRDSSLATRSTGDEFKAAVLLWCASWNQQPAASLPDDDIDLAAFAGYGKDLRSWRKVKAGALRGFTKCDDGRLYHPVVAQKALEAWAAREEHEQRKEGELDRKKIEREWRKAAFLALRPVGVTPAWNIPTTALRELVTQHGVTVSAPVTPPVTVTGHALVTAKTGTGTGTGIKEQEQEQEQKRGEAENLREVVPPAAAADAAPSVIDLTLAVLKAGGLEGPGARTAAGKLRQIAQGQCGGSEAAGDLLLIQLFGELKAEPKADPIGWIRKALTTRGQNGQRAGPKNGHPASISTPISTNPADYFGVSTWPEENEQDRI